MRPFLVAVDYPGQGLNRRAFWSARAGRHWLLPGSSVEVCEYRCHRRVKMGSGVLLQNFDGRLVTHAPAIGPVGGHGVVGVGHVDDAAAQRRGISAQARRIPAAIPVLVMQLYNSQVGVEPLNPLEDVASDRGMLLDQRQLFFGQRPGLL